MDHDENSPCPIAGPTGSLAPLELPLLCLFAAVAGLVDSIVGGGGLVQVPALFLFLPKELAASAALVLGTNKVASMCGTGVAVAQYGRFVQIPWRTIIPAAAGAFACSAIGARLVVGMKAEFARPLILILLVAVAIHTYWRKDFGRLHAPRLGRSRERAVAIVAGVVIGFYDGFFGPGTGSFLIFIFIGLLGFDFLRASASAKVINLATNAAAVLTFAGSGHVLWNYALPMAAANVAGSLVGTRVAVLKGNQFVRFLFLAIVTIMIIRFAWEQFLA